jgi:hexose oxidase
VAPEATAVWQRSSIFKLQYQTCWQDLLSGNGVNGHVYIGWVNDFYGEVYAAAGGIPDPAKDPTDTVDGCYINYCDSDLNAYGQTTMLKLYYGGNVPRLVKAKLEWDPLNYFQNAQSSSANGLGRSDGKMHHLVLDVSLRLQATAFCG